MVGAYGLGEVLVRLEKGFTSLPVESGGSRRPVSVVAEIAWGIRR